MFKFITHVAYILAEIARIPFDIVLGIDRRSYTISLPVAAPKSVTWDIASANRITLEGNPPIEIDLSPADGRPGVYSGHIAFSGRTLPIAYEVLEERPGEALLMSVLKAESAPECCPGENYVCAVGVAGDDTNSVLTLTHQITHVRAASRLLVPIANLQNANRLKYNAELRSGRKPATTADQVKNAVITGLLTFASFFALFGLSDAAMLIGLILVHEVGHVIAMKWVGLPVKGIYFVPFFGGVAVGADRYKSEGERGFVALMGPGFSLITTALLALLASQNDDATLRTLATMSAILNGFNLLPILPLDGGHVAQSLLSRFGSAAIRTFNGVMLFVGALFALLTHSFDLLLVLLLIAPFIFSKGAAERFRLPPMSIAHTALLLAAYAGTFLFYATVLMALAGHAAA